MDSLGRPPGDLSAAEALSELRIGNKYTSAAGSSGGYLTANVSLPDVGNKGVPLCDLWGDGGGRVVDNFVASKLLPDNDASARKAATGLKAF